MCVPLFICVCVCARSSTSFSRVASSIYHLLHSSHASSCRAATGLVVVSLKQLLVIDASDVVTCVGIADIKNMKRGGECEVVGGACVLRVMLL